MNLIEKYLAKAAGKDSVAPGQDITCKVSFVGAHDVTAPVAIRMFREIGVKKVFDPDRVALIVDHVYPASTEKARANVWTMDDFSKEFGVKLYQRGEGVIHQLMYEKHKQNPGDIVVIADSHTGRRTFTDTQADPEDRGTGGPDAVSDTGAAGNGRNRRNSFHQTKEKIMKRV